MEPLETLKKTIDERARATPGVARTFEGIANSVAWQVGVVSPGFLGLLWNARELGQHTFLPDVGFYMLFMGAEIAFLLAIMGSVVLHNFATEVVFKIALIDTVATSITSTLDDISSAGGPTKERVARVKEGLD